MIGDIGSSTMAKKLGSVTDAESEDDVVLAWEFKCHVGSEGVAILFSELPPTVDCSRQ